MNSVNVMDEHVRLLAENQRLREMYADSQEAVRAWQADWVREHDLAELYKAQIQALTNELIELRAAHDTA